MPNGVSCVGATGGLFGGDTGSVADSFSTQETIWWGKKMRTEEKAESTTIHMNFKSGLLCAKTLSCKYCEVIFSNGMNRVKRTHTTSRDCTGVTMAKIRRLFGRCALNGFNIRR